MSTPRRPANARVAPAALVAAMTFGLTACSGTSAGSEPIRPPVRTSASDIGLGDPGSVLVEFVDSVLAGRKRLWSGPEETLPTDDIVMYRGPEHCDWEQVVFLNLGWPLGESARSDPPAQVRQFARDPAGRLGPALTGEFRSRVALPADATDTGYYTGGVHLWLAASDPTGAYLTDGESVERWARTTHSVACD